MFGRTDIVGETLSIGGRSFRVVGVLADDVSLMSDMISNLTIFVPFTVESRMTGQPYVTSIYVSSTDAEDTEDRN